MRDEWRERRRRPPMVLYLVTCLLVLAACGPAPAAKPEEEASPVVEAAATAEPTATEELPTAAAPEEEPGEAAEALPPDPQEVEFQASDGFTLAGTYYPAATVPAPTVVLMHWAPGDQRDMVEIAYWLQNRGLGGVSDPSKTWLDPAWFSEMPEDWSFNVFTFTFRGCEGGCKEFEREAWLLDALAAMDKVRGMPGADPLRVAAIGASVGADGAIDACDEDCLGALSVSPGGYLLKRYADEAERLGQAQPPKPAWCVAAEDDAPSAEACGSASGDHVRVVMYPGGRHGMELFSAEMVPDTTVVVQEFLEAVFGL